MHVYIINLSDTKINNSLWDTVCIWKYVEKIRIIKNIFKR